MNSVCNSHDSLYHEDMQTADSLWLCLELCCKWSHWRKPLLEKKVNSSISEIKENKSSLSLWQFQAWQLAGSLSNVWDFFASCSGLWVLCKSLHCLIFVIAVHYFIPLLLLMTFVLALVEIFRAQDIHIHQWN